MVWKLGITALWFLLSSSPAFALKELRSIPTRPDVTMNILLRDKNASVSPTALILFPGGNGAGLFRLEPDGKVVGRNFLVRTSREVAQEFTAVLVDAPSDNHQGMESDFRKSDEHAADITILMDYLVAHGVKRIFLVGTSMGTLSVASLGSKIKHPALKGIILTSSVEYRGFMRWIPLEKIRVPVLMLHHGSDGCKLCSFSEAKRTRNALQETTEVDLVEIEGGDLPRSGPCEPLSQHGFYGVEEKPIQAIIDWVKRH